jgi:hypothetical protein
MVVVEAAVATVAVITRTTTIKTTTTTTVTDEWISKDMAPDRIKQYQLLYVIEIIYICHRNYSKETLHLDQYKQYWH